MYSGGLYVHLERQENLSLNLSWLTEGCKTVFPSPPQHSLSSSQVPPQADLLLIVFLLTAKFSPQSCFWGYNHVLFYAWGLYCFEFFLQASACQTNKKNKQTNKTFSSLWPVLFPPAFNQPPRLSLCCCIVLLVTLPLVAPEGLLNALCWSLFWSFGLDICRRMWSFCNCKCTFSTIKSCLFCRKPNVPFVKI